ncbi:hypothetical protein TNCV_5053981 [Trichonephila clavipes]|nr:hypothetical protein TNCV_5053981 [Trichonephila clavipes]
MIRDEQYVLSRKQQNIMNEIKNVKQEWAMDQKVILKAKLNEMKAKNDLIQKEKDILKEKNDLIQREKDILKQENDVLKTKQNELNSKMQGVSREIKILKRRLKDLAHLMILIPAKMNSPDYDDFIDMFSVPTPVSPLPPTPVASPSHEASEDVIYDSLPPMEQSTVSESSLKDPMEPSRVSDSPLEELVDSKPPVVSKSPDPPTKKTHVKKIDSVIHRSPRSKERRNEERWNEERQNEE